MEKLSKAPKAVRRASSTQTLAHNSWSVRVLRGNHATCNFPAHFTIISFKVGGIKINIRVTQTVGKWSINSISDLRQQTCWWLNMGKGYGQCHVSRFGRLMLTFLPVTAGRQQWDIHSAVVWWMCEIMNKQERESVFSVVSSLGTFPFTFVVF